MDGHSESVPGCLFLELILSFITLIHQLQKEPEQAMGRKGPCNHFSPGFFSTSREGLGSSLYHTAGARASRALSN